MSDVIRIERGAPPWRPGGGALVVAVFNEYDKPLSGIVEQHSCNYLFDCIYGQVEGLSLWMYSLVGETEAEAMISADKDELEVLMREARGRVPSRLALAIEDVGIVSTSVVESLDKEDVERALQELDDSYREQTEQLTRHQREADDLRSTSTDHLIPA
jgi:hypothetical protein